MKLLTLIVSVFQADDYFFKKPGVVLEEQPLTEVISMYEIKIDYLLVYEHPNKETNSIKELTKCAISSSNTAGIIKRYKQSIDEKWNILLQSSDMNITQVEPRGKRSVLGGLAIGLGSVLAMYSMTHYHQSVSKHVEDTVHSNTEKLDRHINLFKSVMLKNTEHMLKVDRLICELYYGQNYNSLGLYLSARAEIIEKVIVTSASDKIPKDATILNDLFRMCIDTQQLRGSLDSVYEKALIRKLCRTWSVHKSDAVFKGAIKDLDGNIQIKLEISIPVLDIMSPLTNKYKITNLGFYANNKKLRFDLPDSVFRINGSDTLYFISEDNSVGRRQSFMQEKCVTEMFKNGTTDSCETEEIPATCIVKPFKNSFLVCFNGTYREHKATKLVTYTGSRMVQSGEIFCSDGSYIEMIHRNKHFNYTNFYEWHANITNVFEISGFNNSKIFTNFSEVVQEVSFPNIHNFLVYISLGLNFLLFVAFIFIMIKIFRLNQSQNVIVARSKPQDLDFPRAELKTRPKSEYFARS